MVKVERSYPEPASLAVERKKETGSYEKEDVVERLKEDFHDKCYICERKGLPDPQVEHLLPHKNGKIKERKFDWDNLFWVCPHCNGVKNQQKYEEKILDCCRTDPEQRITFRYAGDNVIIEPKQQTDEMARMTAELVWEVFNRKNTGMRVIKSAYRMQELTKEMNLLYRNLREYKEKPNSGTARRKLQALLKRDSAFAAFKRCYIREHKNEYPQWDSYLTKQTEETP